jgi:hypothetical protein
MDNDATAVLIPGRCPPRSAQKRDLYRLVTARSDVTAALRATELMLTSVKKLGDELYDPLWHAIVISYARPFTQNKPHGALPARWTKFDEDRLQLTHDSLIDDRKKFVAHGDAEVRKVQILPPGIYFGEVGPNAGIGVSVFKGAYEREYFQDVYELCYDLGSRLNIAVEELLETLYGGMALPLASFDLRIHEGL